MHKTFHIPESKEHFKPSRDFHIEHAKIALAVDFDRQRIDGSCELILTPLRGGVKTIKLDAAEMEVKGVMVDGEKSEFSVGGGRLEIASGLAQGTPKKVVVEYGAHPRMGVIFTAPDKEHPEKEVQAWTHNEAELAHFWFPCFDHPSERFTTETVISVPTGFRVISNGKLVSKWDSGDRTVYHWKEEFPHPAYLTSFVAAKLEELTQEADGVKLNYNFPGSKKDDVLRYFGETPKMIEVFGELTGVKYPYEKYDQTTVQDFVFGGMENLNATTLSTSYYPTAATEEDFQTSYSTPHVNAVDLVAHELAHQWFGDYVTCEDWHHAWLNEAMATYLQCLYVEKTMGTDQMRWDLDARTQQYFEEDKKEYRRAIVDNCYVFPDDLFDFALYEKGASMVHELRYIMGDEAFLRGINGYLKKHGGGNAETDDFRRAMEKASGLSLEKFFKQAFLTPGHPEFEVEYSWDEESSAARVRVRQVQDPEESAWVFELPCELTFLVGKAWKSFRVRLDARDQTFSFGFEEKPSAVEFDPKHWLMKELKFEKSVGMWEAQLRQSPDAWSRAEAARALGKARTGGVQVLVDAATGDGFWDVKANAFRALGEIGSEEAKAALLAIPAPKGRRERRALVEALGRFKDDACRDKTIHFLKNDDSPYVRCEAALALGKSSPSVAFAYLKEAMKEPSPNDTLREACLEAMGSLKDDGVAEAVARSLAYGNPTRVRLGALKAIKGRGEVLSSEVPVIKEIILHDKEFRVRLGALESVVRSLMDRRFVDEVKAASESDEDLRVRRRALEVYHELTSASQTSDYIAELRHEVEELKARSPSKGV